MTNTVSFLFSAKAGSQYNEAHQWVENQPNWWPIVSSHSILIEPNDEVSDIPTDLVTLSYPERWKDKVEIKVEGKKVSFVNGDTPLFDLCFEECDGYLLGTYDGTPIYIIEYPVETEEQIAMQQDVNVIIDHLCQDAKFVINA